MPARRTYASTPPRPYGLWALLVLTVAAGFGVIAFPTLYIMPFKTQDDAADGLGPDGADASRRR